LDLLTLVKAGETLSGEVILDRLLEKLMRTCLEAAGAQRGMLFIEQAGAPVLWATVSGNEEVSLRRAPLSEALDVPVSVIQHARRTGEVVVLAHAAEEGAFVSDPDVVRRAVKSLLAAPIRRQGQLVGVLCFENNLATHVFTPERVRIFELLFGQIANSLEKSLLFEERARAEASARFLAEAGAILAESLDYEVTLARVARLAVPLLAEWCLIDVVDDGTLKRVASHHADPAKAVLLEQLAERYPPDWDSPQPAGRVLRTGEPLLVPEVTREIMDTHVRDAEHGRLIRALGIRTGMAVPLLAHGRTLGTMSFFLAATDRRYGAADLALAQELGRRAAMAIENARLYRDSQVAVRKAREALQLRDEFVSVASHELRTPLTSLRLLAQMLTRQTTPTMTNARRTFATIERQVARLAHLVDELLSADRIRFGRLVLHLEEVDLAAVVREVVEQLGIRLHQAGCALSVRAAAPVVGSWDPNSIYEIVTNLLDNAIKFGDGKPIEITVEQRDEIARLVMTDHGIGIPTERLSHIFGRFERAVSAKHYGGLGLGLFIVRTLVEALHGKVRAESTLGGGATIVVELPRNDQQPETPAVPRGSATDLE
jgi:signal transduction histidine kinase